MNVRASNWNQIVTRQIIWVLKTGYSICRTSRHTSIGEKPRICRFQTKYFRKVHITLPTELWKKETIVKNSSASNDHTDAKCRDFTRTSFSDQCDCGYLSFIWNCLFYVEHFPTTRKGDSYLEWMLSQVSRPIRSHWLAKQVHVVKRGSAIVRCTRLLFRCSSFLHVLPLCMGFVWFRFILRSRLSFFTQFLSPILHKL